MGSGEGYKEERKEFTEKRKKTCHIVQNEIVIRISYIKRQFSEMIVLSNNVIYRFELKTE